MKLIVLTIISFVLFPIVCLAGVEENIPNVTVVPNTETYPNSSQITPIGGYNPSYSPNVSGVNPIAPLQNTNSSYFSNTTQFSSQQGSSSQCGLSLNGSLINQNVTTNPGYQIGITYNTANCPDYTKLKTIEQEGEARRTKMYVQGNVINNCVSQRALAVHKGQNPDLICKIPDLSQMETLLK
jgi:hypothetical protein